MENAPKKTLFITGAGGFVGRRLLQQMVFDHYGHVYCLCRKESLFLAGIAARHPDVTIISADLFEAERYRDALIDTDIAVHLAAVTGKAEPETHFRGNADGTTFFAEQCKQANIRGFLHFSTIAVNFKDVSAYSYASSKQAAEAAVKKSGLKYCIMRPTIIFGPESPIWKNFLIMARSPVPFVFGNGQAKIQPIHVDDLVEVVVSIIDEERFDDAAFDLGGADVVTIEAMVRQIRRLYTEQPVRAVLRIPLSPLIFFLRRLEPFMLGMLPFTAGQLTSFSSDGVCAPNPLMDVVRPQLRPLDDMMKDLIRQSKAAACRADLVDEGRLLSKRLTGTEPQKIVLEKYIDAHRQKLINPDSIGSRFEQIILGTIKIGPAFYLAEAYSAVFHRTGLLWKKMVLLTAILECMPNSAVVFDEPESENLLRFFFGLSARSLTFALALLISTPIFLPLQFLFNTSGQQTIKTLWKS